MIIKSFSIDYEKLFSNYKVILIYGENYYLKNEIVEKLNNIYKKNNYKNTFIKQDELLNKIDLLPKDKLLKKITVVKNLYDFEKVFLVSAKNGNGCDKLIEYLAMSMPTHPLMYDDNTISDLPLSILASEITREKLFKNLNKELPYNLMVETEKWDVKDDKSINIQQTIYVNKNSHKPIILGKSGQNIKRIGILARKDLEKLLDNNVHLFLFVKFKKNWMEDPSKYSVLGLNYNA